MADNNTNTTKEQCCNTAVATPQDEITAPERYTTPAVDVYETEEELVIVADMPGLESDDIDLSVDKELLNLKGVPRQKVENEWQYEEFSSTSYYRQFRLGSKIDRTRIDAKYTDGVLTLKLPFAEEVKPRRIEIKGT
jgi:HSP20 family protein